MTLKESQLLSMKCLSQVMKFQGTHFKRCRPNPANDAPESDKDLVKHRSPVIPNDFRCPISLELMKNLVIVSTGQTYERSCIQKWIDIPGSIRDCVSSSSNRSTLVIHFLK
ncbi:protein spotted leaf 11-like [Humulus lupulus]|uniref:protein spotted leaf 11-like n=1 Tax=Humulus lupulus TaxID=3486 RepID=UPI002B4062AB|nr:protein spotted leaf 11-like [Humulus lupulus]